MKGGETMPTINDVAKKAGVAVSTVSKVLKNYPNISDETKKKVLAAADELGYVPNMIASALSSKNYNRVALIVNINNQRQAIDEINMQYLFGAFNKAEELQLNVLTTFSSNLVNKTAEEIIRILKSEGVNGIIVYGLNKRHSKLLKIIREQCFSCVVVDAPIVNKKTSSVMVDHFKGQYEVAKKTIEKEYCKKVLYLAGNEDRFVTDVRLDGIKKLQQELGFELRVEYANFSEKKARDITFHLGDYADVIVCASDLMAIGVKNALKEMNIFRPVCGYDGITLMGYAGERMNTVKQDFYHVSEVAVEEMKHLLDGNKGRQVLLDYEIVRLNYEDIIT